MNLHVAFVFYVSPFNKYFVILESKIFNKPVLISPNTLQNINQQLKSGENHKPTAPKNIELVSQFVCCRKIAITNI